MNFAIIGGYAPGGLTVFKSGLLVADRDHGATNGATLTPNDPVAIVAVIEVRPNRGGVIIAAPVVHTHGPADIRSLTAAWLGVLFTAWFNALPVDSGDGPAPGLRASPSTTAVARSSRREPSACPGARPSGEGRRPVRRVRQ